MPRHVRFHPRSQAEEGTPSTGTGCRAEQGGGFLGNTKQTALVGEKWDMGCLGAMGRLDPPLQRLAAVGNDAPSCRRRPEKLQVF